MGLVGKIKTLIRKLLRIRPAALTPINEIAAPPLKQKKNALVIIPFVKKNAYFHIVELINKNLKDLGYEIHGVVHNSEGGPLPSWWDHAYFIPDVNNRIGKLKFKETGELSVDGHHIDDWCSPEIYDFVVNLNRKWKFDICFVHYVFFSKIFEALPPTVMRFLYTHDVYTQRNTRLLNRGLEESFWFSVDEEEEKKGLERADCIFAIQDEEAQYFRKLTPSSRVITAPLFEKAHFLKPRSHGGKKIRIGYFASEYLNNLKTFTDFYAAFKTHKDLSKKFEIVVGGGICFHFRFNKFRYKMAQFRGSFDEVTPFYEDCDLIINPDFFQSGLKMKTFEAMSYGLPILTSQDSTAGVDTFSKYHRLSSIGDFIQALEEIAKNKDLLDELTLASKETYQRLLTKYDFKKILEPLIADLTSGPHLR